ncbi:MAG: hypothetical protein RLZZ419_1500 [Pseudomonadota bacterium]
MKLKNLILFSLVWIVGSVIPASADVRPAMPTHSTDENGCEWQWLRGGGIGFWAENCNLITGNWHVDWDSTLPGFALWHDDDRVATVVQIFHKPTGAAIDAVLSELKSRQYVTDVEDCQFKPVDIRPAPRTIAFFDIRPEGKTLRAFEDKPQDQVPEAPCGEYGWSTHGVRYFISDLRQPDSILYVNEGQDGTMIEPSSIVFE